jgi:hypothetical protein
MPSSTVTVEYGGEVRTFRVVLVREPSLIGAHFFEQARPSPTPCSFVVTTNEESCFSSYSSMSDGALLQVTVREFKLTEHLRQVFTLATDNVSVGRKLPSSIA